MCVLKSLFRAAASVSLLAASANVSGQTPPITEQAARGKLLFFQTTKGTACGTCHQMEGKGTDAGPDLKSIAALSPKGIMIAILSSRTAYMQAVQLTSGSSFPGLLKGESGDVSSYFDFSNDPPKKRELKKNEIAGIKDNAEWKHPPESAGYSREELADLIAYVRWAGKGQVTAVKPEDLKP